jgi:hypothetical protein
MTITFPSEHDEAMLGLSAATEALARAVATPENNVALDRWRLAKELERVTRPS